MSEEFALPSAPVPIPPESAGEMPTADGAKPAAFDFAGHQGTPLAPIRWSVVLLFVLVAAQVAFAFGSSWFAHRSGIMRGLSADARALVLLGIIFVQYLPPLAFIALWARKRGARLAETFAVRRFSVRAGIGLAVGLAFAGRVFGLQYAVFMTQLGIKAPEVTDVTRLFPSSAVGVMATLLTAVVFAPLAEEALFRGVIFPGLRDRWGQFAGMLVSAGLFALVHFSWFQFIPIFVLGAMLAWLTSSTRSIWPAIICHAIFNGTAVALLYMLRALGVTG